MGIWGLLLGKRGESKVERQEVAPVALAPQRPQPRAPEKPPQRSVREVATLIADAEDEAGQGWSFWVEGVSIARENGYGIFDVADECTSIQNRRSDAKYRVKVTKRTIVPGELRVLDIREVESTRTRIVGSANYVSDADRSKFGGLEYLLAREPGNAHDENAVAVYGSGRMVGYISAAKAASFAPIFDALGFDAYRVSGTSTVENSIRLWIDLPKVTSLRVFAKTITS